MSSRKEELFSNKYKLKFVLYLTPGHTLVLLGHGEYDSKPEPQGQGQQRREFWQPWKKSVPPSASYVSIIIRNTP